MSGKIKVYAFSENFILPFSHDEVVHAKKSLLDKMPGDYWQKFAGLRLLYLYQICHPGKKLLLMGAEFGQFIEWRPYAALDWSLLSFDKHLQLWGYIRTLNNIYQSELSLWENDRSWQGFEWVDVHNNEQSILVFIRKGKKENDALIVVLNFTPNSYDNYRIGLSRMGYYVEIFNSDSDEFGGSNHCNKDKMQAESVPWHGKDYSICINVPPLGGALFKFDY